MTNEDMPVLGPKGVAAFTGRGISVATAERFGIYTGRSVGGGAVVPDIDGNVIVFPFFENGVIVAEKYRGPGKKFWQKPGGKRTLWNAEAIDYAIRGPDDHKPKPLVITEGELDALSAIEAGWEEATSVPDGAPQQVSESTEQDTETGKFAFLWNNRQSLKEVDRFVLAVDNDGPGQALGAELVRRLSASRCSFVEYPEGCKDLNDVLMKYGAVEVMRVLRNARPYPVRGLYRLSDYPDLPATQTFGTGWETLDQHLRLFPGELMVVTGIPGHGKSSWVLNLAANVAQLHGWRTAFFSPEMPVVPHMRDKLRSLRTGHAVLTPSEKSLADDWIEDHFLFLDSDPSGQWENDEDMTLEWIMEKAAEAVMRDGVRMLVIDPWNEVEHCRRKQETSTEYIGRAIRDLRRFAQDRGVVMIVVAHPTKEIGKERVMPCPGLYDIDGSAHWANKPDHGISVFRPADSDTTNRTEVHVSKVRFDSTGLRGHIHVKYDRNGARFLPLDAQGIEEGKALAAAANPKPKPRAKPKPKSQADHLRVVSNRDDDGPVPDPLD